MNGYIARKRMLLGTAHAVCKFTGGTADEFRTFIVEMTGKEIQQVK